MYFTSSIGDAIIIPLSLTLSLLSCFSLGVVQLTRAAPTTKPSITVEQYLGLHLQTPKIFFPSSVSQVSRSILTGQPNHVEIDMALPKRFTTTGLISCNTLMCYYNLDIVLLKHTVTHFCMCSCRLCYYVVSIVAHKSCSYMYLNVLLSIVATHAMCVTEGPGNTFLEL